MWHAKTRSPAKWHGQHLLPSGHTYSKTERWSEWLSITEQIISGVYECLSLSKHFLLPTGDRKLWKLKSFWLTSIVVFYGEEKNKINSCWGGMWEKCPKRSAPTISIVWRDARLSADNCRAGAHLWVKPNQRETERRLIVHGEYILGVKRSHSCCLDHRPVCAFMSVLSRYGLWLLQIFLWKPITALNMISLCLLFAFSTHQV